MSTDMQSRLAVVLIGTRNPLNIGAVGRAMSNFGFFDLRLVDPYDEAFREAVSGVGAHDVLQKAIIYSDLESALSGCSLIVGTAGIVARQPDLPVLRLERGARLLKRHLSSDRAAILFGSEKHGLSNADLSRCNLLVRIPTRAEHESMNLGQAVAIALYELIRHPQAARRLPREAEPADAAALERLTLLMKEMLQISSEGQFGNQKSGEEKLRQLLLRARIRQDDAAIWTGHLRQILWKLKNLG